MFLRRVTPLISLKGAFRERLTDIKTGSEQVYSNAPALQTTADMKLNFQSAFENNFYVLSIQSKHFTSKCYCRDSHHYKMTMKMYHAKKKKVVLQGLLRKLF